MITPPAASSSVHALSFPVNTVQGYRQVAMAQEVPAVKDIVTLSAAARSINDEAISQAIWADSAMPTQSSPDGLPPFIHLLLNPEEARRRTEAGLKEAMRQLGIPEDTAMTINTDGGGEIKVEGNFAGRKALESLLNSHEDLRNVVGSLRRGVQLTRIVAAVEKAGATADDDRAREITQQILAMPVPLEMTHGRLSV